MKKLAARQKGASAIFTIIFLAVLGYGIYIGIQYVPLAIESKAIDSILSSVDTDHRTDPVANENEAKTKVVKLLQINEMNDMAKLVSVRRMSGTITIKLSYDREINLIFKKHPMHYDKELVLR